MRRSLALIFGLCAATTCATGTTVFGDLGIGSPGISVERYAGQSFVVPEEDMFLTIWGFEVAPETDGVLDFSLHTFDRTKRTPGDLIFSMSIPVTRAGGHLVLVSVPVNRELTPGASYAVIYDQGPIRWVGWPYIGGNPYSDGLLSLGSTVLEVQDAFSYFPGAGQRFEATFESSLPPVDPGTPPVDPGDASSVPEPATLALVGLSLLGLAAARKRPRRER